MSSASIRKTVLFCATLVLAISTQAEVMMQWFETDWDEMYRKMPLASQIGYDYLWIPPPTKAPTGLGTKWGNVGYSLYDRFDIGDIPQRGSWATRYGSRGSLRNMVDAAHRLDVKIIPDIIMNHTGNGPDFRYYPGMRANDFHVQYAANYCNDLNYKRAPTMTQWYHNYGYGGTMWQDLANLADIRNEDLPGQIPDPNRFVGPKTIDGVYFDFVDGDSYYRHLGQYDKYPYAYTNELAAEMLYRWIEWLGFAMDYDGLRLDAGKHTPKEFFGTKGAGFLHKAQYNFSTRRGFNFGDDPQDLWANYRQKTNALIFAEILSAWSEISQYWAAGSDANPMRYLDYQIKKAADSALNGSIGNFYMNDFGPQQGITYVWGHDEGPGSKANLGYAYILTHIGMPMVYYTGNNINWNDYGRSPDKKTWMVPGYDSEALAEQYNDVANMVWVHQQFARGDEADRWHDNDFLALERYDSTATTGKGLLVVALNDSGGDITHTLSGLNFTDGTILHDYSGHNANNVTVNGGSASFTVPGNSGQGWVFYAPLIPENLNIRVLQSGVDAPTMTWVCPGGTYIGSQTQQITRITSTNFTVQFTYRPPSGGSATNAMLKWAQGRHLTANSFDAGRGLVSGQYEQMNHISGDTNWQLSVASSLPEGLTAIKCRTFVSRPSGYPALFNTQTKVVYVDQRGPELVIWPTNNQSVVGDCIMTISNTDFTAYNIVVAVDGVTNAASEIYKGLWRHNLSGLSAGAHTLTITAYEADWANTRSIINTSVYSQTVNVSANPNTISFNATAEGGTNKLTFFVTSVNAPGSPSSVKLYWNNYELPFNAGNYSNTFNGEIVQRDFRGAVETNRLWGAFVNGPNFFEAVRVDGTATSRATRRIVFNLYGINAIDSDGDSLPDNVEMPFIDSNGAPGADQPWPGDNNKNFIPESGEYWTKLNPYNHSTYFSGTWDDNNDFDGDGYRNGAEVLAGYNEGNIYKYSIYNAAEHPTTGSPSNVPSAASWSPSNAVPTNTMTIWYYPNGGTLSNKSQIAMHIGYSKKTLGFWTNWFDTNMTSLGGGQWRATVPVWSNATSVDFTFWDTNTTWDGKDWQAVVQGTSTSGLNFVMDGEFDSTNYTVFSDTNNMKILAAVKGQSLYVATWATHSPSDDHFIYVTDEIGDAKGTPWAKKGTIFFDTAQKPYISAEGDSGWCCWNNVSAVLSNRNIDGHALEGELDLMSAFNHIPEAVYIVAVAYGTDNATGNVDSQGPYAWDAGNDIQPTEFLRVPIASIRDENLDGTFDVGKPQMWATVNGDTIDANYGLRRIFLNELAGDSQDITVVLQPNAGTNSVSNVELFSNLNRRDFAVLPGDEDPNTVSVDSQTTYYRAYPMTYIGGGQYSCTITANKCGAYRINARFKVNGGSYVYYTDNGLRRDCAVVVSPKKALELTMYELNPMIAEAKTDDFYGRSTFRNMYQVDTDRRDAISTSYFSSASLNMIWLQPIHPIGNENRQIDPATGLAYDPGSPYAVRNYWKVNSVLGDPSSDAQSMTEFTNFVAAMDSIGVGVMLDGTFNHSAWDCEIGQVGEDMNLTYSTVTRNTNGVWITNVNSVVATDLIRDVRPAWYSKYGNYGQPASYYLSANNNDIAPAPDRMDFGKWNDAADFFFGTYDALVQGSPADTNWAWSSRWYSRYLFEDDRFDGFITNATKELWQYFAEYPRYWLEKTGHPDGTPKNESHKGIDGLRCDFAQGLPSLFWEYTINKTRSVKWDFLFMAESLDGYTPVNGAKQHGVGYRSSRHFDILNENLVYYWRNNFFAEYSGGSSNKGTANRTTSPTQTEMDNRKDAFRNVPLLLNLTSHDDVYSTYHQPSLMHAFAELSALAGVPMMMYGQEAGAQNDYATYNRNVGANDEIDAKNNFNRYELNFGKSIVNFKRYNCMTSVWAQGSTWMPSLRETYGKISRARLASPALQSQSEYFLSTTAGGKDERIFALAKFEAPGISAATQDVVLVFVNNNCQTNPTVSNVYSLNADYGGKNWFGIEDGKYYNVVNLLGSNPTNLIWTAPGLLGSNIKTNFYVSLNGDVWATNEWQIQYLKLIDTSATYPKNSEGRYSGSTYSKWDSDGDGLPDWWEIQNGLNPYDATGVNGAGGDKDGDRMSNYDELMANTVASNANDFLEVFINVNGGNAEIAWPSKANINYWVQRATDLSGAGWQSIYFATALSNEASTVETVPADTTNRFYRVKVKP